MMWIWLQLRFLFTRCFELLIPKMKYVNKVSLQENTLMNDTAVHLSSGLVYLSWKTKKKKTLGSSLSLSPSWHHRLTQAEDAENLLGYYDVCNIATCGVLTNPSQCRLTPEYCINTRKKKSTAQRCRVFFELKGWMTSIFTLRVARH